MTKIEILDYEIRTSWWAKKISNPFLQELAARYFVWKVRRTWVRFHLTRSVNTRYDLRKDFHVFATKPYRGSEEEKKKAIISIVEMVIKGDRPELAKNLLCDWIGLFIVEEDIPYSEWYQC